jgi:hypothetical protein
MNKFLAFLGALAVIGSSAQAAPSVWEGDLFVTNVTSQCTAMGIASVGEYFRAVYAPHLAAQDPPEAIALFGPKAALVLQATGGTLRGVKNFEATHISDDAGLGQFSGTVDYTIKPTTITATTQVVQISGTINNFGSVPGCKIGVITALGLVP